MTNIAILLSGQLRNFVTTVDYINSFSDSLTRQNANIDVFVCTDIDNPSLKKLKYVKKCLVVTNINRTNNLHLQIYRNAICYNSIDNPDKYDWFVKIRPDYFLDASTFPKIQTWDTKHINCKLRQTSNTTLTDKHFFSWHTWYWDNADVPDDQLFIIPKSIHKKVFLLHHGEHVIPKGLGINLWCRYPEAQQATLWYSHGISFNPISFKGTICKFKDILFVY